VALAVAETAELLDDFSLLQHSDAHLDDPIDAGKTSCRLQVDHGVADVVQGDVQEWGIQSQPAPVMGAAGVGQRV